MKHTLDGLIAAPFTPMNARSQLALETISRQAELLRRGGVTGAFVCGTTGEGASLSTDERKRVAEAWRATSPELNLIVHVGHLSLVESADLASHAEQIGAEAVAAIAPSFFKPAALDELVEWCAHVAEAAGALPFYYYHMPAMTGVSLPAAQFLVLAASRIPTFAGIKFTHNDLDDFAATVRAAGDRYSVAFGRDELLLSALKLGATAAVGSTYNYAGPLYHRMMTAHQRGDHESAARCQTIATRFIDVLRPLGGIAASKAVMAMMELDCGPVRLPLRELTTREKLSLRRDLEEMNFFDAIRPLVHDGVVSSASGAPSRARG